MFAAAKEHLSWPITTVVNNALADFKFNGNSQSKMQDITWSAFDGQMRGSLQAALNTTQALLASIEAEGAEFGRVINIGSNLVQNPVVSYHDYTSAKAALLGFTRTSAAELGPKGATVNMLTGGLLNVTDASSSTPKKVFDQIAITTPLRKVSTPEDLAGAVLFFASPWAAGITG